VHTWMLGVAFAQQPVGTAPVPSPAVPTLTEQPVTATALLQAESALKAGVITEKSGEVLLETPKGDFTLQNGAALKQIKEKLPLHLALDKTSGGRFYVKVKDFNVKSVGAFKQAMDKLDMPKTMDALREQTRDLGTAAKEAIVKPPAQQDVAGLLDQYRETRSAVNEAYQKTTDTAIKAQLAKLKEDLEVEERAYYENRRRDASTAAAVKEYVETLDVVEKRFYNLNDNYRPEIYPQIHDTCSSCVAIARVNTAIPLGSGVIIGKNLVLTAKHNVEPLRAKDFASSEYEVWLDFEERRFTPAPTKIICDCEEVYRSPELDFVLLRVRRRDDAQPIGRKQLVLSSSRVLRWTPIFLVGHPQGLSRTVHDSSWVLFPHSISNLERADIETDVINEMFIDETAENYEQRKQRATLAATLWMKDQYGPFASGDETVYTFRKDAQECIGAECDTFRGDSGAPAILRENGKVVGILFKGLSDAGASANTDQRRVAVSSRPGAKYFERILPITLIIKELGLDKTDSKWRVDYEVKVEK